MKTVYIAVVFSLIIFVSGCTMPSFTSEDDIEVVGFVGGENSLDVSFVGNNPPSRVFQNHNFNVILQLENKGEYNLNKEDVRVLISNMQNFGLQDNIIRYNEHDIPKRTKTEVDFIPGGIDYISFNDLAYSGPSVLTEDSPISISVDVCYPYQTIAIADICVTRERAEDVCDPFGEPNIQTSSGPMLITKINQLSNGLISTESDDVLLELRIDFEKVGEGHIYSPNTDCSDLDIDEINTISIDQITVGADIYNGDQVAELCGSKDNKVGLNKDGESFVICSITVPNVPYDFEDRFTITTSYINTKLLNKQISVMPVLSSMTKCTASEDCEEDQYCEQPGLCRSKIDGAQLCGLPIELLDDGTSDVSCKSSYCNSNGFCVGAPDEEEEPEFVCEADLVLAEYNFESDVGENGELLQGNIEDHGWTHNLIDTEDIIATTYISNYCSDRSDWKIGNLGYPDGRGLFAILPLADFEGKYCVDSEKIPVPDGADVKVSFMSNFILDGGGPIYDNVFVFCKDVDEYRRIGLFPGTIKPIVSAKESNDWPGNDNGWVKFEYDIPEECIVDNNFALTFAADIDSNNFYGPVAIDDIKVWIDSCSILCKDSDGGKDHYVKGTTSYGDETHDDFCFTGNDRHKIMEYFCEDNKLDTEIHACNIGETCSDGICVEEPLST
jgi:hypothetical protein